MKRAPYRPRASSREPGARARARRRYGCAKRQTRDPRAPQYGRKHRGDDGSPARVHRATRSQHHREWHHSSAASSTAAAATSAAASTAAATAAAAGRVLGSQQPQGPIDREGQRAKTENGGKQGNLLALRAALEFSGPALQPYE